MAATGPDQNEALRRFLQRVWQQDIRPLLRGKYAEQRRYGARIAGSLAAGAGLLLDSLLRLRGRPFTRALTVLGSTFGALLPDVWDWQWLRCRAGAQEEEMVSRQVLRRAAGLDLVEALALFNLTPTASRHQLRHAWREVSQRWHPDKAPDGPSRREYHLRFVTYQAAYQRLLSAYDAGQLPQRAQG
jgi:hypothetical protein